MGATHSNQYKKYNNNFNNSNDSNNNKRKKVCVYSVFGHNATQEKKKKELS